MSFWNDLDLVNTAESRMQLEQAIPEAHAVALIFLALLLAPQIGTQWAVLKWGVGRSSASPSSVLKGQTEAQNPDS